ncbi:hypothetical protein vseg_015222 [Gypsophila vaccaria]
MTSCTRRSFSSNQRTVDERLKCELQKKSWCEELGDESDESDYEYEPEFDEDLSEADDEHEVGGVEDIEGVLDGKEIVENLTEGLLGSDNDTDDELIQATEKL